MIGKIARTKRPAEHDPSLTARSLDRLAIRQLRAQHSGAQREALQELREAGAGYGGEECLAKGGGARRSARPTIIGAMNLGCRWFDTFMRRIGAIARLIFAKKPCHIEGKDADIVGVIGSIPVASTIFPRTQAPKLWASACAPPQDARASVFR